jgi:hypothetical protein
VRLGRAAAARNRDANVARRSAAGIRVRNRAYGKPGRSVRMDAPLACLLIPASPPVELTDLRWGVYGGRSRAPARTVCLPDGAYCRPQGTPAQGRKTGRASGSRRSEAIVARCSERLVVSQCWFDVAEQAVCPSLVRCKLCAGCFGPLYAGPETPLRPCACERARCDFFAPVKRLCARRISQRFRAAALAACGWPQRFALMWRSPTAWIALVGVSL